MLHAWCILSFSCLFCVCYFNELYKYFIDIKLEQTNMENCKSSSKALPVSSHITFTLGDSYCKFHNILSLTFLRKDLVMIVVYMLVVLKSCLI